MLVGFFPPDWKMELLEYSEMLPKNKPQRQTTGWGLPGTGEGGDCFMNQVSFVVMRLFWNKIRAVVAP